MELRNKVFGVVSTLAIGLSLTAGVAFAADEATIPVSLSVVCSELSDITITGDGTFDEIDIANGDDSSQTAENALTVTVDKGCDLGPWHVDAEVSRFGTSNSIFTPWFSGDHFSLEAGPVTSFFGDTFLTDPPTANSSEFEPIAGFPVGDAGSESPIFETTNLVVFGFPTPFDYAAPFVSTAQFTGHLDGLDDLPLADAEYSATLTVILVND